MPTQLQNLTCPNCNAGAPTSLKPNTPTECPSCGQTYVWPKDGSQLTLVVAPAPRKGGLNITAGGQINIGGDVVTDRDDEGGVDITAGGEVNIGGDVRQGDKIVTGDEAADPIITDAQAALKKAIAAKVAAKLKAAANRVAEPSDDDVVIGDSLVGGSHSVIFQFGKFEYRNGKWYVKGVEVASNDPRLVALKGAMRAQGIAFKE